jgi:hypothetical protein
LFEDWLGGLLVDLVDGEEGLVVEIVVDPGVGKQYQDVGGVLELEGYGFLCYIREYIVPKVLVRVRNVNFCISSG